MDTRQSNRRSSQRVPCVLAARITLAKGDGDAADATVRNLSSTGARLHFPTELPNGEELEVVISFPELEAAGLPPKEFKTKAHVIWVLEDQEEDGWPIGLEFDGLGSDEDEFLRARIKALRGR